MRDGSGKVNGMQTTRYTVMTVSTHTKTTLALQSFLASLTPCLPDLAPSDYILFLQDKIKLKR